MGREGQSQIPIDAVGKLPGPGILPQVYFRRADLLQANEDFTLQLSPGQYIVVGQAELTNKTEGVVGFQLRFRYPAGDEKVDIPQEGSFWPTVTEHINGLLEPKNHHPLLIHGVAIAGPENGELAITLQPYGDGLSAEAVRLTAVRVGRVAATYE